MPDRITLEQLEQQVAQLPPHEQLKLVTYISEQLSGLMQTVLPSDAEQARREREMRADALLAELDAIAESIEGEFDSAVDIRQIREEWANRL